MRDLLELPAGLVLGGRGRVVPLAGLPGGIRAARQPGRDGRRRPAGVRAGAGPRRCAARWTGSRPASDAASACRGCCWCTRCPPVRPGVEVPLGVPHAGRGARPGVPGRSRGCGWPDRRSATGRPDSPQPGGVLLSARGEGGGAAGGRLLGLLGNHPRGVTVGLEWAQDLLAVDRPGGLLLNTAQPLLEVLQPGGGRPAARPRPGAARPARRRAGRGVRPRGRSVSGRGAGRRVVLVVGPRSARSRANASTHCSRASSRSSATTWMTLRSCPRVIAT